MAGSAFHFDVRTHSGRAVGLFLSCTGRIELCGLYWVEYKKDRGLNHRTLFYTCFAIRIKR
jgi:hypothetical protein